MKSDFDLRNLAPILGAMQSPLSPLLAAKGAAVFSWLAAAFVLERLFPAVPPPEPFGGWGRLLRNAVLFALTVALSPIYVVPLTAWASEHALAWRPLWWGGAAGLAADLVLLDFLIYWWHRANHRVPFLWRFHEVHHLDPFLDTTTSVRFHFGEVALSAAARGGVILLLGFPLISVLTFEASVLFASVFHHSNIRLIPGFEQVLSRVVVTPSIHWVHHHRVRRDTDSNYGTIFSFWDPLFRSRSATRRTPDMPIGVEGADEPALLALVLRPFRARVTAPRRPASSAR